MATEAMKDGHGGFLEEGAVCPEGYRPNVGVCLVNADDQVFVANRLDMENAWQMPQGGIDDGETAAEAAVRELREETGVTSADIIGQVPRWVTYDFPPDVRARLREHWGKDWKGQAQKWFLFRLTGDESEINLLGDGSEKPEFSEYKWVDANQVVNKAVKFKKAVYEQVIDEFGKVLPSFKLPLEHSAPAPDGPVL